jgi:predicted hotdog family 3-hydroxylacyl-ACP dehydratase
MPNKVEYTSLEQLAGLPAEMFLLHRNPMLLLDTLLTSNDDTTVCAFRITSDWPFVTLHEGVPAYVGVEIMGQCVAAHAGARARIQGYGPPLGFLLGTRHFVAAVDCFAIDSNYRVTCKELFRDTAGMGSYDCCITLDGTPVAEARLAVLEKERGERLSA